MRCRGKLRAMESSEGFSPTLYLRPGFPVPSIHSAAPPLDPFRERGPSLAASSPSRRKRRPDPECALLEVDEVRKDPAWQSPTRREEKENCTHCRRDTPPPNPGMCISSGERWH